MGEIERLEQQYNNICNKKLSLDLTRGKPAAEQLDLANGLDGALQNDYRTVGGVDVRNYGGLDGIPEMKAIGAKMMGVTTSETLVGGNASLTLMYQNILHAYYYGVRGPDTAWKNEGKPKFICLVPGYDRHFTICEDLGIEMIAVPFLADGPDMDKIEELVSKDPLIKGMWCVPRFSNPTGHTFSDAAVDRIAALPKLTRPNFRIMWDNAYAVHEFGDNPPVLANVMDYCKKHNTEDNIIITTSTSKISFAGAGVAFMGASEGNIKEFVKRLSVSTIGPDKTNQLRHARFFGDYAGLTAHMQKHAEILRPKFQTVVDILERDLSAKNMGTWSKPQGGYFVAFDTLPGLAKEVVALAGKAGVKLTPAGATFPYQKDPEDRNIRISPSLPPLHELEQAMEVFVVCVQLATLRQ